MSWFPLSAVSTEAMSLFQLPGATRLFLEKVVFPGSPFCVENNLSNDWERLFSARNKGKKLMTKLIT